MGLNPLMGPGSRQAERPALDLQTENLDARFERLVKAEMERLRPLPKSEWQTYTARISSADFFKLDGSASGPAALAIIEKREVSNEAVRLLTAEAKEVREEATRAKEPELFALANELLGE